jgi:putative transposase
MYNWRKLSEDDREYVLAERKERQFPWHAPPHFDYVGEKTFIVTAACFEHKPIIGRSPERMSECENELLRISHDVATCVFAWCVLPNHYHLLIRTAQIDELLRRLGKFHGSTSFRWNGEDGIRGRKVWFRAVERSMRSERHFFASLNYVNHNAVKHGYATKWQDWPYSSAKEYLETVGSKRAGEIWTEYPVLDFGKDWDPA